MTIGATTRNRAAASTAVIPTNNVPRTVSGELAAIAVSRTVECTDADSIVEVNDASAVSYDGEVFV